MTAAFYKMPPGTMTQIIDHFEKTILWVRHTKTSEVPCRPPPGWVVPPGYVLFVDSCENEAVQ